MTLHCIIHRQNRRFHITDEDFAETAESSDQTAALRIFEWKTDALIDEFAKQYNLPVGRLPADDYLWIDEYEMSPQQLTYLSIGTRGRTTFTDTIGELVQLEQVRERYIACRGSHARPARAYAPLCHDLAGRAFLVVTNYAGDYQSEDGTWHSAFKDGYTRILKQYLYCFDVINAAIAELEGRVATVMQRWVPAQQNGAPAQQANRNKSLVLSGDAQKNTSTHANLGGSTLVSVSTEQDTIDDIESSMVTQKLDIRTAPWTAETIIALASHHLAVPAKPDEQDKAAMERYLTQWYEPALWICHATDDLEPRRAWEVTERRIVGMLTGPTWYAQQRTRKDPITLRNTVGPANATKPLTGSNWRTVWDELEKKQWWPSSVTRYDGPPLTEYEQGYTGKPAQPTQEPPIIVEEPEIPQRPAWMSKDEATDLCNEICDAHPSLRPALTPINTRRTRWYASIQWGPGEDEWLDLQNVDAWRSPTEQTQYALALALQFANPTEVGAAEALEPPPIILEPQDNDAPPPDEESYVSMAEIGEELRGLRPLEALQEVEVASVVAALPLPIIAGKIGMSLFIAEALLSQIASAGYSVQLRNLSEERALLVVETSPGAWIDIESAAQWQQQVKSLAQSPPAGSIAAVLAAQGLAPQMEAMQ